MGRIPDEHPLPPRHPITPLALKELSRYLFAEAVQWSKLDMLDYDNSPDRRLGWEWKVAQKLRIMEAELVAGR